MCGIFGIYSTKTIELDYLVKSLELLQHRGKDSFGIGYMTGNSMNHYKKNGLIGGSDLYNNQQILNIRTNIGIGHVKYKTSNSENDHIQPLDKKNKESKIISMVHNGNIPNTPYYDSQYILDFLCSDSNNFIDNLINLIKTIDVSYNLLIMYDNKLYIVRDRHGIRPLSIVHDTDTGNYYISSETIAFEHLNIKRNTKLLEDVSPGTIIEISNNGMKTIYSHPIVFNKLCVFELLYFMNPNSRINGGYVYETREKLGTLLALLENITNIKNKDKQKKYTVIGIPNSGIVSAKSYARTLGIDYEQLIEKKDKRENGLDRTFIIQNNTKRVDACRKKFMFDGSKIKNKNIILVDDTIVRGNVIRSIINNFKKLGANEIHIRIPAPPIINKCQLGIAIKNKKELLMYNKTIKDVEQILNVDSLRYLPLESLNSIIPKEYYKEYFLEEDTHYPTQPILSD